MKAAGCAGSDTTDQPDMATEEMLEATNIVAIRHRPRALGVFIGDILQRGYDVTLLMMVRDAWCVKQSYLTAGHNLVNILGDDPQGDAFWFANEWGLPLALVTYESLVMRPHTAPQKLAQMLQLPSNFEPPPIYDGNARWYGDEPPRKWERAQGELVWFPERGLGWYPAQVQPNTYGQEYFDKYVQYEDTDMGDALLDRRLGLVDHWVGDQDVVDVGIGCGSFIKARNQDCVGGRPRNTWGYDVGEPMIEWLEVFDLWRSPYDSPTDNITCWDSLEHMPDPAALIERVKGMVFISIPIFDGPEHVLKSKHFRKDEHYWYWTEEGLIRWFNSLHFKLVDSSRMEEKCGREGIGTYVFARESV